MVLPITEGFSPLLLAQTVQEHQAGDAVCPVSCGLEPGAAVTAQPDFQKARYCSTIQDWSLMKLYNICDQANSPRYLKNKVLPQLKVEMIMNNFDPTGPSITEPNPVMIRMHCKFLKPPLAKAGAASIVL